MQAFIESFRRLVRRARRSGTKITYEITVEKDGVKRTICGLDIGKKEAASGQADSF